MRERNEEKPTLEIRSNPKSETNPKFETSNPRCVWLTRGSGGENQLACFVEIQRVRSIVGRTSHRLTSCHGSERSHCRTARTAPQPTPHCPTAPLPHCRTAALPHCRTAALPHCRTAAPSHCRTVALPHCRTAAPSHCRTVALSHCRTVARPHCRTPRRGAFGLSRCRRASLLASLYGQRRESGN